MRRCLMPLFALVCAALFLNAQSPRGGPSALPPIDATGIAAQIVRTIAPSAGERAIIAYDPDYYAEIARAVQAEFLRAGVHPVVLLNFDPPEAVRAASGSLAERKKREEELFTLLRPVFAQAQIFLWLPARALHDDHRWERLIEASHVRAIHFHWILPLEGHSAEEVRMLSKMYEHAILTNDYAALSREQDRMITALRGQSLRITTPDGTDLLLRVSADAWFHKNDGDMSLERARSARSVRDFEMELPAGALRFIPDPLSAEGRIALPRLPVGESIAEGVVFEYEKGRMVRFRAEKNEAGLRAYLKDVGGDIDRVGEIVLGTNPLLAERLSGFPPYYGYGDGYLRISLGDNWESGGTLRSPASNPVWLIFPRASLTAGERPLITDGKIVGAAR